MHIKLWALFDRFGCIIYTFTSKYHLFKELLPRDNGRTVINVDDAYGQRLATMLPCALTCGRKQSADIYPESLHVSLSGISGRVATPLGPIEIVSSLLGDFNVENPKEPLTAASKA